MRNSVPGRALRPFAPPAARAPRSEFDHWTVTLARGTIVVSFVFMALPAIDLAVSGWFFDGSVFGLADQPVLKALRQIGLKGPFILIGLMVLLLCLRTLPALHQLICAPRKALFVMSSFVSGQILVEVVKPLIGRARPRNIIEFGGDAEFTPLWQISSQCGSNCSLPSGEAAAAAAGLSLLVFVPARHRSGVAIILAPILWLIAFNRVLFGGHFLSDVILGWLLTVLAMVWLWKQLVAE